MLCPVDGETLVMADRHGVEIDYCPKCRGVWLDRGELDKILDRAAGAAPLAPAAPLAARPAAHAAAPVWTAEPRAPEPPRAAEQRRPDDRYRRDEDDDHDDRRPKRRRESFLSELFDF